MPKPPYRVPSMTEIAQCRGTNELTVVSTFSGCGGSCLGFEMEGFRILWANEFIARAAQTYRANHPDVVLDTRDIRTIRCQDILAAIQRQPGEIDVLEGSPPCAAFSTAGNRHRSWGKVKDYSETRQQSDDLFFEFARILAGLQPKVFVAENVSGLVKGVSKGYFKEVLAALKQCGYTVEARLLDAQWLGVPQRRQRLIFVGIRRDLQKLPVFPAPLPYRYSIREACSHLNSLDRTAWIEGANGFKHHQRESIEKPMATVQASRPVRVLHGSPPSSLWTWAQPSATIQASADARSSSSWTHGTRAHPVEHRALTIAELKCLCAFPDDFVLYGTYAQQWERLGRSVPPVMMAAIARTIREQILLSVKKEVRSEHAYQR